MSALRSVRKESDLKTSETRSYKQNRMYRKLLRKLAKETGFPPDAWHEYFKKQYLNGETSRTSLEKWEVFYLEVESFCAYQGVILEDL